MVAAVLVIYLPPAVLTGKAVLYGLDYAHLHYYRIRFAQAALFGPHPHLPGWYPREFFGAPFWANINSFPWIPTRLALLFIDPIRAFTVGALLAAVLSALFTYLLARQLGLGRVSATAAGWTFACAGSFASRLLAGHLVVLEAYPALPLLLWLAERALDGPTRRGRLLALAFAGACVVVAGHPQLPAYICATTLVYLIWRAPNARGGRAALALLLGIGTTLAVWWPTLLLIHRSTRVLSLAGAANDVVFPYGRLGAFFLPWKDGWPALVNRSPTHPFTGYPDLAYFWDTVCYIGWLPPCAAIALAVNFIRRRDGKVGLPDDSRRNRRWIFFGLLGVVALVSALPCWRTLTGVCLFFIHGTFLRSPARQLYLVSFVLALAFGLALDRFLASSLFGSRRTRALLVALALALQFGDLGGHTRDFVVLAPPRRRPLPAIEATLRHDLDGGRVAIDESLTLSFSHTFDDLGFFDSLILARPYRAVLRLNGAPPTLNVQNLEGSQLNLRTLQEGAVRFVLTRRPRPDLVLADTAFGIHLYAVPRPAPRASFVAGARADAATTLPLQYVRPSSDQILVKGPIGAAGFVRVAEAYDPGWSAKVDGVSAPIRCAAGFELAVPVHAGVHEVQMTYRTPGARTGRWLALLCACALALVVTRVKKPPDA